MPSTATNAAAPDAIEITTEQASARNRRIIEIAKRETSTAHVAAFAPITRGPIFACVVLSMLAIAAAVYLVYSKLRGLLGSGH